MCHNHSHVRATLLGAVLNDLCEVRIFAADQAIAVEAPNGEKCREPYCMMLSYTLLPGGTLSSSDYPLMVAHCMLAFAEAMTVFVSSRTTLKG
jgi:hypothetical protein